MIVGRHRGCSLSLSLSWSFSLIVVNFLRLGGNPRFVEASRVFFPCQIAVAFCILIIVLTSGRNTDNCRWLSIF